MPNNENVPVQEVSVDDLNLFLESLPLLYAGEIF